MENLNMNKKSSWNNQETMWTSVKGVKAICSQPKYGRIGN